MARGSAYAKGKWALGECARSGRKMLLRDMVADGYYPNLIVDPEWYEPKHPQESLPSVRDPVSLYRPAPERDQIGAVVSLGGAPGGGLGEDDPVPGGGFGQPGPLPPGPGGSGGGAGGSSLSYGFDLGSLGFSIEAGQVLLKASGVETVNASATFNLDLSADLEVGCQVIVFPFAAMQSERINSLADLRCIIPGHTGSSGFSSGTGSGSLWWFPRNVIGDPTDFDFTNDSATGRWYVMWWVVQNLNQECPIQNLSWSGAADGETSTPGAGNSFVVMGGAPQIASPNSSVIEIWQINDVGSISATPITTRKGPTPDDLFDFETFTDIGGTVRGGWLHASFYNPGAVSLCENLLPDTANQRFQLWTPAGGGLFTPDADPHYGVEIDDGIDVGVSGPHGCFKLVTLQAGVTYCLAIHWRNGDEQGWFFGWEEVASPGINGQFCRFENSGTKVDQVTSLGAGWDEAFHCTGMNFSSLGSAQSSFFLTPSSTGSYRIYFAGPSDNDTTLASLIYDASLVTRDVIVNAITLSSGNLNPPYIPSLVSAVPAPTVAPGFLPKTLMRLDAGVGRSWGGDPVKVVTFELVGNVAGPAILNPYHEKEIGSFIVDDDRLGVGNDYTRLPQNTHGNRSGGHMIGRLAFPAGTTPSATGMYYCEMTVGSSVGTPTDPVVLGVYVGIYTAHIPGGQTNSASDPGDEASERAWVASYMGVVDGQTHHNSVTTNGLATYTTGDVIGIALDLVAGDVEWFKNGSSIRVETLSAEFLSTVNGDPIPAYVGAVCSNNEGFALRWTMKAPFAFTKPVGFQDWDYL